MCGKARPYRVPLINVNSTTDLLQVDLLNWWAERALFGREAAKLRAIWNPTKDFFESLPHY